MMNWILTAAKETPGSWKYSMMVLLDHTSRFLATEKGKPVQVVIEAGNNR